MAGERESFKRHKAKEGLKEAHNMELQLFKKPKGVRILQGFPGMGLIGTISTEYLMEHYYIGG